MRANSVRCLARRVLSTSLRNEPRRVPVAVQNWSGGFKRGLSSTVSEGITSDDKSESPSGHFGTPRTPEGDRAAQLEYEHMERVTERLLSNDSQLTPASIQELRAAFQYWVARRSLSIMSSHDKNGLKNAQALFQRAIDTKDAGMIHTVIETEESSCGGVVSLLELLLVPFRGTHQSFVVTDKRLRFVPDTEDLKSALVDSSKIMKELRRLLDDSSYEELVLDRYTRNMVLNLWSKRCWFLNQYPNEVLDTSFVQTALGGATTSRDCLDEMQVFLSDLSLNPNYPPVQDDAYMLLMTAWVHSGLPERAAKAQEVFSSMDLTSLGAAPYNAVLYAYASLANEDPSHATRASIILEKMPEAGTDPDVTSYATVLLAFANARQVDNAEQLLSNMERDDGSSSVRPNTICYNTVLDALAKLADYSPTAERAEALLERMQYLYDEGINPDASPDIVSYSSVIEAWARSSDPEGADRANEILIQCQMLSETRPNIAPDRVAFNIVLDAYARQSENYRKGVSRQNAMVGAERADELLERMRDAPSDGIKPDIISYNCVLNAWAKSGTRDKAANRAREIMSTIKNEYEAGNDLLKPDLITYNVAMGLIARSGQEGCVAETEALFQEIKDRGFSADTVSYNTFMDAMIKSGEKDCALHAEELLREMEEQYRNGNENLKPNQITYNTVVNAYAKSRDPEAAKKAESLLERMLMLSSEPDRGDLSPSMVSFSTVVDAYASRGQVDAAEALVRRMDDSSIKANTITYNTVLNALAKSDEIDAPQRAEALLNSMQEAYDSGDSQVRPNTISFSTVIHCWGRSGLPGAADRAEAILQRMEQLNDSGQSQVRPNAISYSACLNAFARSGEADAGERAVRLLGRMEDLYHGGKMYAKPNAYCYNATINGIAKSSSPAKASLAHKMLQRMIRAYESGNLDAQPSATSFSSVLNACAYTSGSVKERAEAFRIARITFKELLDSNYGEPNTITYVNFMRCCENLLPDGPAREAVIVATFRECSQGKNLNGKIIAILRANSRPHVYRELMAMLKDADDSTGRNPRIHVSK